MSVHTRRDLDRLARLARREFSSALMSDTKWRKLLWAVDAAGLRPERTKVKFIDAADALEMSWPGMASQHPPAPWVDSDCGPIELRAIEWLLIPSAVRVRRGAANVPPRELSQNVDAIEALIAGLGCFPLERTTDGLKIVGYRR